MQYKGLLNKLDIESWNRREHFHHFSGLDDPYWGLVVNVNCTAVAQAARSRKCSFFLLCLHASLQAANATAEFGYRIVDGEVCCYAPLHASATIMRADETFGCCFIEYRPDFKEFAANAFEQIELIKGRSGMCLENDLRHDQIYFSSLPWLKFSALTFARNFRDSAIPKFIFGKAGDQGNEKLMPVALQVHHALVDGLHVSRFFERFQSALDNC